MNIYYYGIPGAYTHMATLQAQKNLNIEVDQLIGEPDFSKIWEKIDDNSIGVIPIENSYAGPIHKNLYNFLRYDHQIIGELSLKIEHCLLSKETDLSKIKKVYSHPQALSQCYDFLKKHNLEGIEFADTALASKFIAEEQEPGIASIASSLTSQLYNLNILEEGIQDQTGNTTRFFVLAPKNSKLQYTDKKNKISLFFETRHVPAALYKCLGGFATNGINLHKIESLPALKNPFSYLFWIDLEGKLKDKAVQNSLEELAFFTKSVRVLGEY